LFTGIIESIGHIQLVTPLGQGVRLRVHAGTMDLSDVRLGDSIAIQGACMTAVNLDIGSNIFEVDVSAESLDKTVGLSKAGPVNLEKALALGDRLGGHLVTGHVDGLGHVVRFEEIAESWLLDIKIPPQFGGFFAGKGSATINGVSLTTNSVRDEAQANGQSAGTVISMNLIPHTIAVTTLKYLQVGQTVNFEVDVFARYCERMLSYKQMN
jgi:riboflavin synthase